MEKELLYKTEVQLELEGRGKSEQEATQNIFNILRSRIHSEIDGYLVEMHVTSFVLMSQDIEKKIKKFLYFFMPVEYETYIVRAKVTADVSALRKERG